MIAPKISTTAPNNCFFRSDYELIFITRLSNKSVHVTSVETKNLQDYFQCGINSTQFKMGFLNDSCVDNGKAKILRIQNTWTKAVCFPTEGGFFIAPLHHESKIDEV